MLKYKLNVNNKRQKTIEVLYDSLFLSKDGSTISGVTDPSYGLSNCNTITVTSDSQKVCNLTAHDVMCGGYVIYNQVYKVEQFTDVVGVLYYDGQYYCVNKDYEKTYRGQETEILDQYKEGLSNPFITIDNHEYEIGEWGKNEKGEDVINWKQEIIIPTKYWVYDNKITINNITYDVAIDTKNYTQNDEKYQPYIVLNQMESEDNERILYIIDWEYSKRTQKTLFVINGVENTLLMINKCHSLKFRRYFEDYDEKGYPYKMYDYYFDDEDTFFNAMFMHQKTLSVEWEHQRGGDAVDLYLKNPLNKDLPHNAQIWIKRSTSSKTILKGKLNEEKNEIEFSYYGKKYSTDSNKKKYYLLINGIEYEIFNYKNDFYVIFKHMPLNINFSGDDKTYACIYNRFNTQTDNIQKNEVLFEVKSYNYLDIDNEIYKIHKLQKNFYVERYIIIDDNKINVVKNNDGNDVVIINGEKYEVKLNSDKKDVVIIDDNEYLVKVDKYEYSCEINHSPSFQLQIIDTHHQRVLRCQSVNGENLTELFDDMDASIQDFVCELKIPIFDIGLVEPLEKNHKEYVTSNISLSVIHGSFALPLKLESDNAINLHQDYITHNNFVTTQTSNLINRIVDMEKDIYYPTYAEKKGNDMVMTLCHQIQIDLHFRTRDLKTWVINDKNVNADEIKYPDNWNIFDYYTYPNDKSKPYKKFYPKLTLSGDNQYYLPSDLLYFLNFTNEDVFYQKQKIGKSFLMLSFYDTPNPQKQSLLYTSTIFMSETLLYQKYINKEKTFNTFITIKDRSISQDNIINGKNKYEYDIKTTYTADNQNISKNIGVDKEPCLNDRHHTLTFDENKRLSSSFIIKNRNEALDSSEGFYLYLFKEYANGFHERSIYMRVQFNHAGMGKTINFMQLFNIKSNGEKTMLNWSSKFNFEKYKDGCPLKELYDHIYIEIKVNYDMKNKRFCYYLPQWMSEKNSDKYTMRLSLFEVKIKDESNENI